MATGRHASDALEETDVTIRECPEVSSDAERGAVQESAGWEPLRKTPALVL
jgi:hypothetical protein